MKQFNFEWLQTENLEPVFLDQVRIIKKWQPCAIIGDQSPTLKMAAEKTGTTYISLLNSYMTRYYKEQRSISQTHPFHSFMKVLPAGLSSFFSRIGETYAFYSIHKTFKLLRRKYGLKEVHDYLEENEGDLNLISDLPRLFPLQNLPHYYKWIPPLYYTSDDKSKTVSEQLDKTKKTLYVSMGSSGEWEKVLFLNHPSFQQYNIITAGDMDRLIKGPTVIAMSFVSAEAILPFTDLVICHGGNGTIYQSLAYGIPVLCKTSHVEQEWNVQALEQKGLGQSLDQLTTLENCQESVDYWKDKKGTNAFFTIQEEIRKSVSLFDKTISSIVPLIVQASKARRSLQSEIFR